MIWRYAQRSEFSATAAGGLRPESRMDPPYQPCWCGSGKKWKWCHKDREQQPPVQHWQVDADLREQFAGNYGCSHPNAPEDCVGRPIRSHTVQRRGGLAAIAEDGHVLSVKAAIQLVENEPVIVPQLVGLKSATTFMGFCAQHDSTMFQPAETSTAKLTAGTAFLLSFRAVSYEVYQKRAALEESELQRELDRGKPFEVQAEIQQQLYDMKLGMRAGLRDLEALKAKYDAAYQERSFSGFRFFAAAFSGVLPVVASGGFYPECDFADNALQRIAGRLGTYESVTYNLTVLDGRSVAVIGWHTDGDGPAYQFAESFAARNDDAVAEAAVRLAFEHLENTCMRPSWWAGLSTSEREALIARIEAGTGCVADARFSLVDDARRYASGLRATERLRS